jgi:glucans biosynthesis protein
VSGCSVLGEPLNFKGTIKGTTGNHLPFDASLFVMFFLFVEMIAPLRAANVIVARKIPMTVALHFFGVPKNPAERNHTLRLTLSTALMVLLLELISNLLFPFSPAAAKQPLTFKDIVAKAQDLSRQPFQDSPSQLPKFLLDLTYDQWRDIRFRTEKSLWRSENLPFEVQFFHPGWYFKRAVTINVIDTVKANRVDTVPFSSDLFHYGMNKFPEDLPANLGFAGFRVHYPLNKKNYKDEFVVFLGASYFRAVAKGQHYGLSGRGLAVNTAAPTGEEFPFFKEFWLDKPYDEAEEIFIYALLDSPSFTGAYKFIIEPGEETVMEVECTLFQRKEVEKVGIAPLTSMFFYGENTNIRPIDDFRPEVHDSDGLLISTEWGEWIWRPLVNPANLRLSAFQVSSPVGFGLFQRDQKFDHYQDLEAYYENRPSVWITPKGKWGKGHIELIQIPTETEYHDNIVAYWVPAKLPTLGEAINLSYKVTWMDSKSFSLPLGRVVSTYVQKGDKPDMKKFLIDFVGDKINALPAEAQIQAAIDVRNGARLLEQQVYKNPHTGGWRLGFQILMEKEGALDLSKKRDPIQLRAFLREREDVVTETWDYEFQP